MRSENKVNKYLVLLAGTLAVSSCTCQELTDDFTKLRVFEAELGQLSAANPALHHLPQVDAKLAGGHVVAITITGDGLHKLPASIYAFQQLTELVLEETALETLPDLRPLAKLRKVTVEYNLFKGPVHLRNLPASLEYLELNRDAITEVLVDDTLPNLSWLSLTQNRMGGHINSTFCKLPNLTFLDLSFGCCLPELQKAALEKAARKILCTKKVAVKTDGRFVD